MSSDNDWSTESIEDTDDHLPENSEWALLDWADHEPQPEATDAGWTTTAVQAQGLQPEWGGGWDEDTVEGEVNQQDSEGSDQCFICGDNGGQAELLRLPCESHTLCMDCLRYGAESATRDESIYPLNCGEPWCGGIPDDFVEGKLNAGSAYDQSLSEKFSSKIFEYKTPAAWRTYCANHECQLAQGSARFLDGDIMGDEYASMCFDCSAVTCKRCKALTVPDQEHTCNTDDHDAMVKDFIDTLLEDKRWLWQKCFACRSWVEKTEACNHMICRCGAGFCLICGRPWQNHLTSCTHGCPHYEDPVYDSENYNQHGYHRETGLDREGNAWIADYEHDGNQYDDENNNDHHYEEPVYGDDGFDQWDRDIEGYGRDGFNQYDENRQGRDRDGYDVHTGFNEAGYDRNGFDTNSMDAEGYFDHGYNAAGFNRDSISRQNWPKEMYDQWAFDPFGYSAFGYTMAGYDFQGRDSDGRYVEGYDTQGFNLQGWDREDYDRNGYSRHHKSRTGQPAPGFFIAEDGNVQHEYESALHGHHGPDAEIMDCDHQARYAGGSRKCYICHWQTYYFYYRCGTCSGALCRQCSYGSCASQQAQVRQRYLWPGGDSFGVAEMLERMEDVASFKHEVESRPRVGRRQSFAGLNSVACEVRASLPPFRFEA